ncbi:MAG: response regulator [Deltaproteobacteria bacterium]|nr:response regulator [Deltaproteobacteria bacterium]
MESDKKRILVVDDNLELAEMIGQLLGRHGFRVSIAPDGRTAVEKVLSESPELVLLDLNLPDIAGGEVLKKIKETDKNTAVIILTAYGGEQVVVDLMKAGAEDFISKPFDNELLINSVKEVFKIRELKMEDKMYGRLSSFEKFFPFLAHEIRNPLHAISGALAIIQRRSNLQDEVLAKSVRIIQEEVQHLSGFVQECLDFIRPPVRSRFIQVDVNEVISVVINIISHIFEDLSKKIKIREELQPKLPQVLVNYEEIKQAFLNIVKNSFEAMGDKGELVIKTRFKAEPLPGWVEIIYTDNGPGIKKENLRFLFHPFFTTKLRGTGLGLAICRRIIAERHNGKIHVESEEGKGTIVTVKLPRTQASEVTGEYSR